MPIPAPMHERCVNSPVTTTAHGEAPGTVELR